MKQTITLIVFVLRDIFNSISNSMKGFIISHAVGYYCEIYNELNVREKLE